MHEVVNFKFPMITGAKKDVIDVTHVRWILFYKLAFRNGSAPRCGSIVYCVMPCHKVAIIMAHGRQQECCRYGFYGSGRVFWECSPGKKKPCFPTNSAINDLINIF